MQLQSIPKQSSHISTHTRNLQTKQELQTHILLTGKALALRVSRAAWEIVGKKTTENIIQYLQSTQVFVAHTRVIKRS